MSNLKHVLGLAILLLPQSCGGHHVQQRSAPPVRINAVITKMHAVCASMGDKLESTNSANIGDNGLEFACSDKDDVWYWIRWRDVKGELAEDDFPTEYQSLDGKVWLQIAPRECASGNWIQVITGKSGKILGEITCQNGKLTFTKGEK